MLIYSAIVLINITFLFLGIKDYDTATKLIRLDILLIQIVLVFTNIIVIQGYFREHIFTFGVSSTCMYILLSISSYLPHFFKGVFDADTLCDTTKLYFGSDLPPYLRPYPTDPTDSTKLSEVTSKKPTVAPTKAPTTTTTTSSTSTGKVATGDSTSVAILVGMLMLAGAGIVVTRKKIAE